MDLLLRIRKVPANDRAQLTDEALEMMELQDLGHHLPNELSGGQQQRVSLARAVAARPGLLVADEPTGQLDSDTTKRVLSRLKALTDQGITMLVATHDPLVADIAHRTVEIARGVIIDGVIRDGVISDGARDSSEGRP